SCHDRGKNMALQPAAAQRVTGTRRRPATLQFCTPRRLIPMQTNLGFANFLAQLDGVGITVLLLLLALSVASWYLILTKSISNYVAAKRADAFLKRFWSAGSLHEVDSTLKESPEDNAFAQLARQAMDAADSEKHS